MKDMLKSLLVFSVAGLMAFWVYTKNSTEFNPEEVPIITADSPPCLQMYYLIEKYSEKYNIGFQHIKIHMQAFLKDIERSEKVINSSS
jgi:hypothetical protein